MNRRSMNRWMMSGIKFAALIAVFALGTLYAQQKTTSPQGSTTPQSAAAQQSGHDMASMPGMAGMPDKKDGQSTDSSVPMVFCPTMKTGQLCTHGSSDALNCAGAQRDRWVAAVRQYNRAVDAATKQLQADAKTILTPEQAKEVNRWFAVGLNPQINQVLMAAASAKKTQ